MEGGASHTIQFLLLSAAVLLGAWLYSKLSDAMEFGYRREIQWRL